MLHEGLTTVFSTGHLVLYLYEIFRAECCIKVIALHFHFYGFLLKKFNVTDHLPSDSLIFLRKMRHMGDCSRNSFNEGERYSK